MPAGRPSSFTPEIGAAICSRIAEGRHLSKVCEELGIEKNTVWRWRNQYEDFRVSYARATIQRAELWGEEIIELSESELPVDEHGRTDSGAVQALKLRIDTKKWVLGKVLPATYGERIEIAGDPNAPLQIADRSENDIARRIALALALGLKARQEKVIEGEATTIDPDDGEDLV